MRNPLHWSPTLKDLAGFLFGGMAVGLYATIAVGWIHSVADLLMAVTIGVVIWAFIWHRIRLAGTTSGL